MMRSAAGVPLSARAVAPAALPPSPPHTLLLELPLQLASALLSSRARARAPRDSMSSLWMALPEGRWALFELEITSTARRPNLLNYLF